MKYSHKNTDKYYEDIKIILKEHEILYHDKSFISYIRVVMSYAYYVRRGNPKEQNKILELSKTIDDSLEKELMTLEKFIFSRTKEEIIDGIYENGMDDGIERGMKQGLERGRETHNIEIAKSMKQEMIDVDVISKITGLTKEYIESL